MSGSRIEVSNDTGMGGRIQKVPNERRLILNEAPQVCSMRGFNPLNMSNHKRLKEIVNAVRLPVVDMLCLTFVVNCLLGYSVVSTRGLVF